MLSSVEPGVSVAEALLQVQAKILVRFPEIERVFGKAGRANTSAWRSIDRSWRVPVLGAFDWLPRDYNWNRTTWGRAP